MGRPREHDEATSKALLRAAEQLLAEGGPDALSVRRVSDAAGTTTRAVYSLFGSKDGLLSALYQAAFQDLRRRVLAVPQTRDPVADLARTGIDGFRAQALAHPHLFRLAFEWPARATTTTDADRREALATFEVLLHRIERAAGGGGAGVQGLAVGFHALCQGLASGELAGQIARGLDMRKVWQDALTTYVRGFAGVACGERRRRRNAAE